MMTRVRYRNSGPRLSWLAAPAALWVVLSASGCFKSHTIEPGTWKLTFKNGPTGARLAPPEARTVDVSVDWGKKKGTEVVRVELREKPTEEDPEGRTFLLQGGIIEDGKITLEGVTRYYMMRIWGQVTSPTTMQGPAFARGRINDKVYFDGTWRMVKVPPRA